MSAGQGYEPQLIIRGMSLPWISVICGREATSSGKIGDGNVSKKSVGFVGISALMAILVCAGCAADSSASMTGPGSEMAEVYGKVCLDAFPDQVALKDVLAQDKVVALPKTNVSYLLHGLDGDGWQLQRPGGAYIILIQKPPYPTCEVRLGTTAGLASMQSYKDVLQAYADRKSLMLGDPQQTTTHTDQGAPVVIMARTLGSANSSKIVETSSYTSTDYRGHTADGASPYITGVQIRMAHQLLD